MKQVKVRAVLLFIRLSFIAVPGGNKFLEALGEGVIESDVVVLVVPPTGNHLDGDQVGDRGSKARRPFLLEGAIPHVPQDLSPGNLEIVGVHQEDEVLCEVVEGPEQVAADYLLSKQVSYRLLVPVDIFYDISNH